MFTEAISSGTGASLVATLLANDKANLILETSAVLNTGLTRGDVVKFSPVLSKWVACDGTVSPDTTDIIGIVDYASGTTGQIRLSGVYQDDSLSTLGAFYCQADGTLGSVKTKVFVGRVTSAGKLCMPGGGGGSIQAATADSLGGIMVGAGLNVTADGLLSANVISVTAGTVAHGGTIPLPSGYTRGQCKYAVWANTATFGASSTTNINCSVNQSTGVVAFQYFDGAHEVWFNGTAAGYLCIGVK